MKYKTGVLLAVAALMHAAMAGAEPGDAGGQTGAKAEPRTKTIAAFYQDSFGDRQGNAARGKKVVMQACAQCHGAEGNAASGAFPNLSAQLPHYLASQLMLFKIGVRRSPVMQPIAASLSARDMLDAAAYYASRPAGKPYDSDNAELLAHGRALYRDGDVQRGIAACTWCHGAAGNANPPIFPRIGGQSPAYLEYVLDVLKTRRFHIQEAYVMKAILANLTADDIKAVSVYVSTLPASWEGMNK